MLPPPSGNEVCLMVSVLTRSGRSRCSTQTAERQDCMMYGSQAEKRRLSARRLALLATSIAGLGAAALLVAPNGAPAQAQDLSARAQQLPQKPVGFADIVEKVKPAVISVRVKMERPGNSHLNNDNEEEI